MERGFNLVVSDFGNEVTLFEQEKQRLQMDRAEVIELRDLLLREFPVEPRLRHLSPQEFDLAMEPHIRKERRERIAGLALQGLLTADPFTNFADAAEDAIGYADALVAALDKES